MKRTFIFIGIGFVLTFLMLYVLNKVTSKSDTNEYFTEAKQGEFVIAVNVIGELAAEKSVEIKGPSFAQSRNVRSRHIKILDLVPEGTMIREGDYIATLDRTDLENTSKDLIDRLKALRTNYDMKKLDTAVALSSLRNGIKNQNYVVEEAVINLSNSKYEEPFTIRRAEIELNKSRRKLEQQNRNYMRSMAQGKTDLKNQAYFISRMLQRINDIEQLIAGFTITSPENGMVIYKRNHLGIKRKIGSTISPFDRGVAILPDLSSMISKTYVSEIDIRKIKVGQKVRVTIDAFPKKAYDGTVFAIANIGEGFPNSSEKVFEVQIKIDGFNSILKPSMTTGNNIVISTFDNAVYVPIECVHTGTDGITFIYTKDGNKQIVLPGESNGKNIIIEKGLDPGTIVYLNSPENPEKFDYKEKDLIPLQDADKETTAENDNRGNKPDTFYTQVSAD